MSWWVIGLARRAVSAKVSVMSTPVTLPPVLLLHGFLGAPEDWDAVCHAWQPSQPVYAYSGIQPFGYAQGPPFERPQGSPKPFEIKEKYATEPSGKIWDTILKNILAYMDQRNSDDAWDIVGYSMGGRIAWMLAYYYPHRVRRLCILSANPGLSSPDERQLRALKDQEWADCLRTEGMVTFLHRWYAQPLFASFRQHALFSSIVAKRADEDSAMQAMIVTSLSPAYQPDLWSWVLSSQIPTLYLSGDSDVRYTEIGHRLSVNQAIRHETIPGAGHVLHLEAPAHVAEVLQRFLT